MEDQVIRFTFLDPVNGYIELVLEDMDHVITQGWNIDPHMEPLRVRGSLIHLYTLLSCFVYMYTGYIIHVIY